MKRDIKIFILLLTFSCMIFTSYLIKHFSADIFYMVKFGYDGYAINYSFLDGRIFMGIIGLIANITNIPLLTYNRILLFLALAISCIIVVLLKNNILKYKKVNSIWQEIFIIIVCYYTIFHFLYLENLYFAESFVMALSLLFYILSAISLVEKKKLYIIKAFAFIFLGLMSYQATISMFFICVILFSLFKEKEENYWKVVKNFLIAILLGIVAIVLNNLEIIIVEKLFNLKQTRGIELNNIFFNIRTIISNLWYVIINTSRLFPKYLFIIILFITQILIFYKIVKKNTNQQQLFVYLEQLILIIFSIALSFIPSIASLTAFYSARLRFTIGATLGIVFMHLIVKTDLIDKKTIINKILITIFLIYAIFNSTNYIYLMNLNMKANELDEKLAHEIGNYIEEYEKNNSTEVKNIKVITIKNNTNKAFYKELNSTGVGIAVSAIRTNWSVTGAVNYYTNRNLTEKEPTKNEENTYLEKVDSNKDYLCIGDTLFVSAYMY